MTVVTGWEGAESYLAQPSVFLGREWGERAIDGRLVFAGVTSVIRRLVSCSGMVLSAHGPVRESFDILRLENIDEHSARVMLRYDPVAEQDVVVQDVTGARLVQAPLPRWLWRSHADPDSSVPRKGHVMQMVVGRDPGLTYLATLVRLPPQDGFSKEDAERLLAVYPVIEASLKLERAERLARDRALNMELALHEMALGVIVFDGDRQLMVANEAGQNELLRGDVLRVTRNRIVVVEPRLDQRLRDILGELLDRGPGSRRGLCLLRQDRSPLQVAVTCLSSSADPGPRYAMFLADPAVLQASEEMLRDVHGLTRMEAQIVSDLCLGASPADAAKARKLSIHTVRDYLKSTFQKMCVNRQIDVVRLALLLGATIRPKARGNGSDFRSS